MSDQKLSEYTAKHNALLEAKAKAESLVKLVLEGAAKLKPDWKKVEICNTAKGTGQIGKHLQMIDGRSWPTAQDLADAFLAYHNAVREAQHVYNELRAAGWTSPRMVSAPKRV